MFQAISQLATRLCSVFYKLPLDLACLQSPGRRNISKLCLFCNYHGYSIICFTACLQLVGVSTVFVFLGRGLLEQDPESQEDQYLFEICLVEHSVQICHRLPFPVFPFYPSQFTACPGWNLLLCCICLEVTCYCKVQSPKIPRTTKPAKASTSAAEEVQKEI